MELDEKITWGHLIMSYDPPPEQLHRQINYLRQEDNNYNNNNNFNNNNFNNNNNDTSKQIYFDVLLQEVI